MKICVTCKAREVHRLSAKVVQCSKCACARSHQWWKVKDAYVKKHFFVRFVVEEVAHTMGGWVETTQEPHRIFYESLIMIPSLDEGYDYTPIRVCYSQWMKQAQVMAVMRDGGVEWTGVCARRSRKVQYVKVRGVGSRERRYEDKTAIMGVDACKCVVCRALERLRFHTINNYTINVGVEDAKKSNTECQRRRRAAIRARTTSGGGSGRYDNEPLMPHPHQHREGI